MPSLSASSTQSSEDDRTKLSMEREEEDQRREAAIAATPCLQPNFNSRGLTKEQLAKFRELHKRRIQVKSKLKFKTKPKDETKKSKGNNFRNQDTGAEASNIDNEELILLNYGGLDSKNESFLEQDNESLGVASKNRQKLHWGLDAKERWERKSNM